VVEHRAALTRTNVEVRLATVAYKACSCCGIEKAACEFSPDKRATTGLQPRCRECASKAKKAARDANLEQFRERERAYVHANKERVLANNKRSRERRADKVKATKKAWYESVKNTPEFKAKVKARTETVKERKREYDREYRKRDPQKAIERAQAWRKANPEKRAAIIHNYVARRRAQTESGVSTSELLEWKLAQKKICYWCGTKCAENHHVDHYVPLSKGGAHELSNLVIACGPCNLRKNAKDPLDFAKEVGRLL